MVAALNHHATWRGPMKWPGRSRWFCGDADAAHDAYRRARSLFEELGVQEGVMLTEHHFGQVERQAGPVRGSSGTLSCQLAPGSATR